MNTPPETQYQQLATLRNTLGLPWYSLRLSPFDRVLTVNITENFVYLECEVYRYKEQSRRYVLSAKGTHRRLWKRDSQDSDWYSVIDDTEYDASFSETYVEKYGTHKSVSERIEQHDWEVICNRPGTSKYPLDSAQASDSPRMDAHWKL